MGLVYGSVCSGIEAASVAWEGLGWRASFFSEIDPMPRAVLAHRYGCGSPNGVPLHGDFTTIEAGQYEPIDFLVGGTPCQDFSIAGKRAGLDGERGNLTLEFARLARRLRAKGLVWENVPGVFSNNAGRDFGAVLACFAGYPDGAIFEPPADGWRNAGVVPAAGPDGYGLAWRVLDSQFAGVPQRRRRVFVVGYIGDWRYPAAVLLERHSLQGHPPPRRQAGQDIAGTLAARAGGGGRPDGGDGRHSQLIAFDSFNQSTGETFHTIRHDAGPEGIPCIISTGETSHCLNAGGMGRQDYETETLIAHALRGEGFDASEDGTGRGTPLVPVPFDTTQITSKTNRSNPQPGDPCHPLAAAGHAPAIAFDCKAGGDTSFAIGEMAGSLRGAGFGGGHAAVAFDLRGREGGAQFEGPHDTANIRASSGGSSRSYVQQEYAVRRLTPLECERLQGFPDGWTDVPYRGKPAADGPRYKALGNSMTVDVMRWIGQRIALVDQVWRERRAA